MSKKGNIHIMCANIPVEDLGEWSRDSDPPPKYIITSDDCLVAGRPSNSSETDLAGEESLQLSSGSLKTNLALHRQCLLAVEYSM